MRTQRLLGLFAASERNDHGTRPAVENLHDRVVARLADRHRAILQQGTKVGARALDDDCARSRLPGKTREFGELRGVQVHAR